MKTLGRGGSSVVLRLTPLGAYVLKTPLVAPAIMEAELPSSFPSGRVTESAWHASARPLSSVNRTHVSAIMTMHDGSLHHIIACNWLAITQDSTEQVLRL